MGMGFALTWLRQVSPPRFTKPLTTGEYRIILEGPSATPQSQGAVPQRSPIWGLLSINAYTLCHSTIFDVETHMGGACILGQPRLPPQERRVVGLPNFGAFPVFMPTLFNAERRNSAW